jgi:hypothetical protein
MEALMVIKVLKMMAFENKWAVSLALTEVLKVILMEVLMELKVMKVMDIGNN